MPVEIRELVIRAIATGENSANEDQHKNNQPPVNQEAIVQECVRQVMNILKKKEER